MDHDICKALFHLPRVGRGSLSEEAVVLIISGWLWDPSLLVGRSSTSLRALGVGVCCWTVCHEDVAIPDSVFSVRTKKC